MLLASACLCLTGYPGMAQEYQELEDTRHDLALYLTPRQADKNADPQCIFCHLPERSSSRIGRWHDSQPDALFDYPYARPAAATPVGKPDGSTLVCLSCHDGTIALGDVYSRTQSLSTDNGVIRTDLSDGHPVSILYDSRLLELNQELATPAGLPAQIKLDSLHKIQCTTCHDPHDDTYGNFLVMDNGRTTLCLACHQKTDWESSAHNQATAVWNLNGPR